MEPTNTDNLLPIFETSNTRWYDDELDKLLVWAEENGCSDVSLQSEAPIWARKDGFWQPVTLRPLITDEIDSLIGTMTRSSVTSARLRDGEDSNFSYDVRKSRFETLRFRGCATAMKNGPSVGTSIVLRSIKSEPPLLENLNPEPMIIEHGFPTDGLVMVTGVMGSGKSTLLAAMLRKIIETTKKQVITYEAPVEFDLMSFKNAQGFCIQTDIPTNLKEFDMAPRNSTRRAADVVLLGESRDYKTFRGLLEQVEIGVAGYTTVHSRSVAETITRIINIFPQDMQNQMKTTLIAAARLIVQQRLVPKAGGGRVALREILAIDSHMRNELFETPNDKLIQTIGTMVTARGQTLLDDARAKLDDRLIEQSVYHKIAKEYA